MEIARRADPPAHANVIRHEGIQRHLSRRGERNRRHYRAERLELIGRKQPGGRQRLAGRRESACDAAVEIGDDLIQLVQLDAATEGAQLSARKHVVARSVSGQVCEENFGRTTARERQPQRGRKRRVNPA